MNSFRFDLATIKRRVAEIEANARAGRMPTPVEVVFLCEILRDLVNVSVAQEEMIEVVERDLQDLVETTRPPVN